MVPSCAEGGVLGVLPGLVGTIQANEAIKLLLGYADQTLTGRLLLINAMTMRIREMKLRKNPDCPVCGTNPTVTALMDYQQFCGLGHGDAAPTGDGSADDPAAWEIAPEAVKALLDNGRPVTIVDVREPHEYDICHIEGATLIPLSELPGRVDELNPDHEIVLHCHHGGRSFQALTFLRDTAGFTKLKNLRGGIDAWAEDIEPEMARY